MQWTWIHFLIVLFIRAKSTAPPPPLNVKTSYSHDESISFRSTIFIQTFRCVGSSLKKHVLFYVFDLHSFRYLTLFANILTFEGTDFLRFSSIIVEGMFSVHRLLGSVRAMPKRPQES